MMSTTASGRLIWNSTPPMRGSSRLSRLRSVCGLRWVGSDTRETGSAGTTSREFIKHSAWPSGCTNTATRTVLVRDTTPPTILWSFTNLVLAAGTNCTGAMPEVTGTNYILATDSSGTLTLTQVPTNNAALPLGTNVVVITVADASGTRLIDQPNHRPGPSAAGDSAPAAEPDEHPRWERRF